MEPSQEKLEQLNTRNLMEVKNLKIFGENCEIEFLDPVNMLDVDIDNEVFINSMECVLYPYGVPATGFGLNQRAKITFKNRKEMQGKSDAELKTLKEKL